MKCYKCAKTIEDGVSFVPIDPKGTPGRRWACLDCLSDKQFNEIPEGVRNLSAVFDEKFISR